MSRTVGLDAATTISELPAPERERRTLARRILVEAIFLGGIADSLLHEGLGVGLFILMIVFATVAIHMVRQRPEGLRREAAGWLAAAFFFAGCFAWRDSSDLLFYDFVATIGALLFFGATLSPTSPMRSILGQRVMDLARGLGIMLAKVLTAFTTTFRESAVGNTHTWRSGRSGVILRAVVLALPVVILFGALLNSADPLFGALLSLPKLNLGEVISHVVLASIFAWIAAGWLRGAFGDGEARVHRDRRQALTLGTTDVTAILGSIVVLFTLFVGVQIGWLFGGERLVRSTTGLGYAEYARHGFFELVAVSLLLLPVLLGTRALIGEGDALAVRRHRTLATPLLVLLGGVMASAFGRMALYVHYYGPSTARLYASVFMIWLAIVFAWFGLTILRGRTRDFAAGMTITGFITLALLNVSNPELLVARASIARASEAMQVADSVRSSATTPQQSVSSPIDYQYLSRLSGNAAEEVVGALLRAPAAPTSSAARTAEIRARCTAVRSLLNRWGSSVDAKDWRLWDAGAWQARSAVRRHERELRTVTCLDAGDERPFGDRERRAPLRGEQDFSESH